MRSCAPRDQRAFRDCRGPPEDDYSGKSIESDSGRLSGGSESRRARVLTRRASPRTAPDGGGAAETAGALLGEDAGAKNVNRQDSVERSEIAEAHDARSKDEIPSGASYRGTGKPGPVALRRAGGLAWRQCGA